MEVEETNFWHYQDIQIGKSHLLVASLVQINIPLFINGMCSICSPYEFLLINLKVRKYIQLNF